MGRDSRRAGVFDHEKMSDYWRQWLYRRAINATYTATPQSEHSGAGGFEPQFVAPPIICQRIPTIRLCFSSKQSYISVDGRYWTDANVD